MWERRDLHASLSPIAVERLEDEGEATVVERPARRVLGLGDALAQAARRELQDAIMTVGVVPRAAEERVRRPRAAAATHVRVVARPAEPPQIVDVAIAREPKRVADLPHLLDAH